jgi:ketosteroid isomerase-like protein
VQKHGHPLPQALRTMRKTVYFLIVGLLLAAFIFSCEEKENDKPLSAEAIAANAEAKIIEGLRAQSNLAIAQKDTNKIASFMAPDFTIVSSRSFEGKTREVGRHLFALEYATKKDVIYERIPDKVQVYPNWKMAAEYGHWTGSWIEPDGKIQLEGTYYAKWHKLNGEWKIRVEVFVPLACKGSAACDKRPF